MGSQTTSSLSTRSKTHVAKDSHGDWVMKCGQCNVEVWCSDWKAAMESAWGHIMMNQF